MLSILIIILQEWVEKKKDLPGSCGWEKIRPERLAVQQRTYADSTFGP
jgi:hypothetical protein